MGVEDDIKLAELEIRKLEIRLKQKDLDAKPRFGLAGAAVLVTVIGGLSAVFFQGLGVVTSSIDKNKAEIATKSDFDFKGLELFVKEQEHLITCDTDESQRNIRLFQTLFSERVTSAFSDIVAYRSQKCVTQSANSAAEKAKNTSQTQVQIDAAADAARYAAIAQRAPLLAAGIEPGQTRYRVFLHINSEGDRAAATALQAALIQKGYSAPGIESVSSAPNRYEVRFYYRGQADDAKTLAAFAASQLGISPQSIEVPPALEGNYKSLPRNTMEFWFPRREKP